MAYSINEDHHRGFMTLLTPGPCPMYPEVRQALREPLIHHRSSEFKSSYQYCKESLRALFKTEGDVLILLSTGSGGLEASLSSYLKPLDKVLVLSSGKFGERWGDILRAKNIQYDLIQKDEGDFFSAQDLPVDVSKKNYKMLCVQACETSTGTKHDIDSLGKSLASLSPETLFCVDGITAVGAYPVSQKGSKIDILVSGSQKALALPAGMSFVGLSPRAIDQLNPQASSDYFNLHAELQSQKKNQTRYSGSSHLILALKAALGLYEQKGESYYFNQVLSLNQMMAEALKSKSLKNFSKNPSPSLTAFEIPDQKAEELKTKLEKKKYLLASGQGVLKNKILRVGHMGNIETNIFKKFISTFKELI